MKGVRHSLRDFTASAVKEHLRSQAEDAAAPALTKNELALVEYICHGSFDWDAFLVKESAPGK